MLKYINGAKEIVDVLRSILLSTLFFLFLQVFIERKFFDISYLIILIGIYIATELIRLYFVSWFPYFSLQILVLVSPIIIHHFYPYPVFIFGEYIFFAILYFMQAVDYWIRNGHSKNTELPWQDFLMCIIITLFSFFLKAELMVNITYNITLVLIILYLMKLYLEGIISFLTTNQHATSMPVNQILSNNISLVLVILILLSTFTLCVNFVDFSGLYTAIKMILLALLKFPIKVVLFIIRLLDMIEMRSYYDEPILDNDGLPITTAFFHPSTDILYPILRAVVLALIFYGVVRILAIAMRKIIKSRRYTVDLVENTKASETKLKKERIHKKSRPYPPANTNQKKVRKNYFKKIKKYEYQIELEDTMTTKEIEKRILDTGEDTKELTALYEKTRYSTYEVSAEDVKRSKELSK